MKEGFPLQRYTAKILQRLGWEVDEEYPVLQEVSQEYFKTSGDVRALYSKKGSRFALRTCVSCKRQHNIDWVFMKAMYEENAHDFIRHCWVKDYLKQDELKQFDFKFHRKDWKDGNYPLCNIPTNLIDRKGKRSDDDKIIETCESLYFEVLQSLEDDGSSFYSGKRKIGEIGQIIYLPVIVTAAQISCYDIDESNFGIEDTDAVDIKQVPFLLYQHRIPQHMQKYISSSENSNAGFQLEKFNIFIVFYKDIEAFYNMLIGYFTTQTISMPKWETTE